MPAPIIPSLPDAPLRSEAPTTFTAKAEAWVDAIDGWTDDVNAFGSYLDGLGIEGSGSKLPVRVATTAAGTLASSFENGDTIDGVVLATGDRILIKNQSAGAENGIYTVNASGAPTRATGSDTGAEILGSQVYVIAGTTNGGTLWFNSNTTAITLGTTAVAYTQFTGAGYAPGGTDVAIADGGTGASTAAGALTNLGAQTLGESAGYNAQTGTSYTLVIGDKGKLVAMNNASANTLTVPPNADVAFPVNTRIDVAQYGAGQTTITPGSGVTIRASGSKLKTTAQYSGATLQKIGTNEWWAFGDLSS